MGKFGDATRLLDATGYTATVGSSLYHAGRTMDGEQFIAECYTVILSNARGRQFIFEVTHPGAKRWIDEEGDIYFSDIRKQAYAEAQDLANAINDAIAVSPRIDADNWQEIDPVYGSEEYQNQGTEIKRAYAERQEN